MVRRETKSCQLVNAKRKVTAPKENWQAIRRRYTWHLRPPFKAKFDRAHWWNGQKEIEPAAALYELARRHPLVREKWLKAIAVIKSNRRAFPVPLGVPFFGGGKFSNIILDEHWFSNNTQSGSVPHSLYWTCLFGLKSWAQLDYTDRSNWKFCVGQLKGLDFRDEELQCRSINKLADWKISDQREAVLGDKVKGVRRGLEMGKILNANRAANPPTAEEWEAAIAYRAVEAHRQGYLLLAVAPDLQSDYAASLMQKVYGSAKRKFASPKQRARWKDWLPLIAKFENEELLRDKKIKKSQAFIRYRRALDGIHFA